MIKVKKTIKNYPKRALGGGKYKMIFKAIDEAKTKNEITEASLFLLSVIDDLDWRIIELQQLWNELPERTQQTK